jgi:hypothetical protein
MGVPPSDAWLDPLRFENVCFDTMVIRHLVHAGGGDILKQAFAGRMAWPEIVATELHLQSEGLNGRFRVPNLSAFLGTCGATILTLTEDEELEVEDIRLEMHTRRSTRADPQENLGEAQCLLVCRRQPGYPLVCHDGRARGNARDTKHYTGIRLFHAIDVLHLAIRLGLCRPARAWELYVSAVESTGMYPLTGHPIPAARDRFMAVASTMSALWQTDQRAVAPSLDKSSVDVPPA